MEQFVVARVMGGLGNQMFQLAAAIGIASRFGGSVAIDTHFYSQTGDWTPRLFSLHTAFPLTRQFLEVEPHVWETLPHVSQGDGPYIDEFNQIACPVYLDGYWQSEKCFLHCESSIRSLFSFPALPECCLPYANSILRENNSVSMHVRRGDYVHTEIGNRIHNVCGSEYYSNALQSMLSRANNCKLFMFSDEPDWIRHNFSVDIPCEIVDTGMPTEPWHDMHLMSLCKHHIVANSTFSWWGAWLGNHEGVVLAPHRWVNTVEDIPDIIADGWETI